VTKEEAPHGDELAVASQDAAIGVVTAVVGAVFGPAGAVVGALIGPYAKLAMDRLTRLRQRINRDTGLDEQEIVDRLDANAPLAHLVAEAVRGTVESDLAAKRDLLTKAVVRALEDDAVVDTENKFVRAANEIDTADVRVLRIIGEWWPNPKPLSQVVDAWPGSAEVIEAAGASLTAAGLVWDSSGQIRPPGAGSFPATVQLTTFGRAFLERLMADGLDQELAAMDNGSV
jgi:hypothetical protein